MKKRLNGLIFFGLCTIFLAGAVGLEAMEQPPIILDVGCYTLKGARHTQNEDRFLYFHGKIKEVSRLNDNGTLIIKKYKKLIEKEEPPLSLFAIFDGHGGNEVSEYLVQNFYECLKAFYTGTKPEEIEAMLKRTIEFCEKELIKQEKKAGSTLVCVLYNHIKNTWHIAHIGDSRAIIKQKGQKKAHTTKDHDPFDNKEEKERVERKRGVLNKGYVFPSMLHYAKPNGLAMSRSMGDFSLKNGDNGKKYDAIIAEPTISKAIEASPRDFVIIASDGFWDVIKNEEAILMVKELREEDKNSSQISEDLCQWAQKKGSIDDITVIVVMAN